MKILSPVVVLLCVLSGACVCTQINETILSERSQKYALFSIVNFPNDVCETDSGENGMCVASSECIGTGGEASGSCAQGFGTCCYYRLRECGGEISRNLTHLQSPSYPDYYTPDSSTTCSYTFTKVTSAVCQVRLDFVDFETGPPISNNVKCSDSGTTTDYVSLFHSAGSTTREETTHLCGLNTGYHVYLEMGAVGSSATGQAYIEFKLDTTNWATFKRRWNLLASQIECDRNYHAPQGCLQYFAGNEGQGTVEAFNFNQPTNAYAGHLSGDYRVCIRREEGNCAIGWTPPKYSEDTYAWSVSGSSTSTTSRIACGNPSSGSAGTTCTNQFVRIPGASNNVNGAGPFTFVSPTPATGCDRFCGKKFCAGRKYCKGDGDHAIIYSKEVPFLLEVNFDPAGGFPQSQFNKGFKLNFFQVPC